MQRSTDIILKLAVLLVTSCYSAKGQEPPPSGALPPVVQLEPLIIDDGMHEGELVLSLDLDNNGDVAHASSATSQTNLIQPAVSAAKVFRHPNRAGQTGVAQRVTFLRGKQVITVPPEYPAMARNAHVSGTVELAATVAADGHVSGVTVLSGPPLLQNSARDSLLKWRFPPMRQSGVLLEAHAVVLINYALR